jgi:hypothetical protein
MTEDQKSLIAVVTGLAGLAVFLWVMYALIKFLADNWIWVGLFGAVILAVFYLVSINRSSV